MSKQDAQAWLDELAQAKKAIERYRSLGLHRESALAHEYLAGLETAGNLLNLTERANTVLASVVLR